MIRRQLDIEIFLGSTTEQIRKDVRTFCGENAMCPGNLVDFQLHKLGGVYQLVVWYARVVEQD